MATIKISEELYGFLDDYRTLKMGKVSFDAALKYIVLHFLKGQFENWKKENDEKI